MFNTHWFFSRRRTPHYLRDTRHLARGRSGWWTAPAAVLLTAVGIAQSGHPPLHAGEPSASTATHQSDQPADRERPSDLSALPALVQAQISSAIGQDDPTYHVVAGTGGLRLDNPDHALSAEFGSAGVELRKGSDRWGLTLRGYGYGDALRETSARMPDSNANRVEYRRGGLIEWYVNGPVGLEQGFTLAEAPGRSSGEPLTLAFALSGNLAASVADGGRALVLSKAGVPALRYGGLTAFDADHREFRAWLEVDGNRLRIRVDDGGARYPLTIDPFMQAVKLTSRIPCSFGGICDDGAAFDSFGAAVSLSGDGRTLVVGVPNSKNGGYKTGAAYVFLRPPTLAGGWSSPSPIYFAAKLRRTTAEWQGGLSPWPGNFGSSVSTNHDGSTIVIGDPTVIVETGQVYVFVRPPTGWSSTLPRYETAVLSNSYTNQRAHFGTSVAISPDGSTIVAGSPQKCVIYHTFCVEGKGAAYVYVKPAQGWTNATETAELKIPNSQWEDGAIGRSIAVNADGSTVVAGGARALHIFQRPTFWINPTRTATLTASDNTLLGTSVSMSGDATTIVAGGPLRAGFPGTVYVFTRPGADWIDSSEIAQLTASDGNVANSLGYSVGISGDGRTIVAGAPSASNGEPIYHPGAAYVFGKPLNGWMTTTETSKLTASDISGAEALFGRAVTISDNGTEIVAGAPRLKIGSNFDQGAAYVYVGTAFTANASVSHTSLTFDPQPVGTTTGAKTVTVSNTGTAPLYFSSVAVSGSFNLSQDCVSSSPVAPGGSCSAAVAFAPTAVGTANGVLTFTNNSGGVAGSTQQVQLSGDGIRAGTSTSVASVAPNPALAGQPVTVAFSVSPDEANTLTPSGTVTVQASTGESCTGSVQSGSCVLNFSTAANRSITASFGGDANFASSTSASVSVQVVDFTVSVSPSSLTVNGKKATFNLSVAAVNGLTGSVSLACSGGPQNTTCGVSPASVSLSGTAAAAKATLTLPNGAPSGSYTITFSGASGGAVRSTTATLIVK